MMPQRCSTSSTLASKSMLSKNDMKRQDKKTNTKVYKSQKHQRQIKTIQNIKKAWTHFADPTLAPIPKWYWDMSFRRQNEREWDNMRQHHPCLTLAHSISSFVVFFRFVGRVEIVRCAVMLAVHGCAAFAARPVRWDLTLRSELIISIIVFKFKIISYIFSFSNCQTWVRSDREAKIVARIAKVVHWRGSVLRVKEIKCPLWIWDSVFITSEVLIQLSPVRKLPTQTNKPPLICLWFPDFKQLKNYLISWSLRDLLNRFLKINKTRNKDVS